MGFLATLLLIIILIRIFAPHIRRWLLSRLTKRMNDQFERQFGFNNSDQSRSYADQRQEGNQTDASARQKQDLKEIDNKRFDKTEGEYVDFEEVK